MLGKLPDLLDIHAVVQLTSITSTEQRAHMQVSSNDRSERTIVFTVSIFGPLLLCDSFQESNCYQLLEIILPFPVQARMSPALNNFCHAVKTKTCPSSLSWQCGRFIGHSCSNPVHIDHQCRTESTHAGVEQ